MPPSAQQKIDAQKAELLIQNWLQSQGWKILARNFRCVGSELDIVTWKGKSLVFVEVKYRRYAPKTLQECRQLLPFAKRRALERGAKIFLTLKSKMLPYWEHLRFDLAVVHLGNGQRKSIRYFVGV